MPSLRPLPRPCGSRRKSRAGVLTARLRVTGAVRKSGSFDPQKHPRANDGRFGHGSGKPAKPKPSAASKPAIPEANKEWQAKPSKLQEQARQIVAGKIKPTKERAFNGKPVPTKEKLSKQLAGAIGEEVLIQHLKAQGFKDATQLSVFMKTEKNNLPIDLIQDHELIEAKTGQASNGEGAQQWRLTIGEPGKAEKAWLKTASPEEKKAWNAEKAKRIERRKQQMLRSIEKRLGYPIKIRTMTVILNPDTKTADLYSFPGVHPRIGWTSAEAKAGYIGSVAYGA